MLAYISFVLALAPVLVVSAADSQQWDNPTHGPPTSLFKGDSSLPIDALAAAAKAGRKGLASYRLGSSDPREASIFGDWGSLQNVRARSVVNDCCRALNVFYFAGRGLLLDCGHGRRL
jgi:hypothetical protein